MHMRLSFLMVVLFCCALLALPACAQRVQPAGGAPLPAGQFAALVTQLAAFQQQRAWDSTAERAERARLDELQPLYDALRTLIADGDLPTAVPALAAALRGRIPPLAEVNAAWAALTAARLPLAADALAILCHPDPPVVILAFTRIPEEDSAPLAASLYDRHNPSINPLNYIKLASTALDLYSAAPDRATRDGLLRFLLLFGFGSAQFNLHSVGRVYEQGNPQAALALLQGLFLRFPHDTTLHARAAQMLGPEIHCTGQEIVAMLQWMTDTLPPPYARRIRADFYRLLAQVPECNALLPLDGLLRHPDPLLVAESHLAQQQYPAAAALFAALAARLPDGQGQAAPGEPLLRRLAAWSGLWDTDPDAAVALIAGLTDDILQLPDDPERTALIRWFGNEMGRVAPFIANGWKTPTPKATAPACYTAMADSLTRLLQADPLACLRTENANGPSLRYAGALIYTLAHQGAAANAALAQVVTYQECPLPGTRLASSAEQLATPLPVTAPRLHETDAVMRQLAPILTMYDKSFGNANTNRIDPEPPNTTVIRDICAALAADPDDPSAYNAMQTLAAHFAFAMEYLDPKPEGVRIDAPPPAPRAVNLAYLPPITEAIEQAFRTPDVCRHARIFLTEGLQPALLSATNPELLDALFALTIDVLDHALAAGEAEALRASIINCANYIEGRRVWNLKPYADTLRARYLTAE